MRFERFIERALTDFADSDPTEGPIVGDAIEFVSLTDGICTPWVEQRLGEPMDSLRFKYREGENYKVFAIAVEILRLVYSPRQDQVPEIFYEN